MKTLLTFIAALLGAAVFAVPALADTPVFGHVRPDDRAGVRGPGGLTAGPVPNVIVRPDDRVGIRGPGGLTADPVPNVIVRPDDRAGIRRPGAVSPPIEATVAAPVSGPDFDWGDAGIGATAGVGLVLVLLGASRLIRHARTEPRSA